MSPIHDQSYRRYQGSRLPLGRAWAVVARAGYGLLISRRIYLVMMLLAWVPFIVRAVQIYFVTVMPQAGQLAPVDAAMFQDFIEQQSFFVFIVTLYVGAGLVANDRRANALQIYLSKPMLRTEYIGGKLLILVSSLLLITLVPGLLLIMLQVGFSGSLSFLSGHLFIVPAVVLACLLRVLVASVTMLALSSLSKSARYAAVLYTGALFFTESMFTVLRLVTRSTRASWVSISANIEQVTDTIFRVPPRYETPTVISLLVLVGLVVLSISVLENRVRGVEVVK